MELRLAHRTGRLGRRAAYHQRPIRLPEILRQLLDRTQAGAVHGGHVAAAQDHDRRQ